MGIGISFLSTIATGIINQDPLGRVARYHLDPDKCEHTIEFNIDQIVDSSHLQLGCRL